MLLVILPPFVRPQLWQNSRKYSTDLETTRYGGTEEGNVVDSRGWYKRAVEDGQPRGVLLEEDGNGWEKSNGFYDVDGVGVVFR